MFSLRPAYVVQLASDPGPVAKRTALVGVGAARASTKLVKVGDAATNTSVDTKVDPKDIGLYVGLPAVGAGVVAVLAGLSIPISLLVGLIGGAGGYFYLDYKNDEDRKLADAAALNAKAAVDAKEKERLAKLDVVDVSLQADAIGMSTKAGLELFSIGFMPGAGAVMEWKYAGFKAVPTDDVVKQLTDLQKALADGGYARAASQIAETASSAALLRDSGGTVLTATPPP